MMKSIAKAGLLLTGACLCLTEMLSAQIDKSNARGMALGGAYSAVARGAEAVNWNPAVLGLRSAPRFSLLLPGAGLAFQNSSFTLNDYRRYNGAVLTEQDKTAILGKIPNEGLGLDFDSGANVLALSVRRFAFAASVASASNLKFSRQFIDLALNGNQFEQTYDFSATDGEGFAAARFAISYGQPVSMPGFRDFALGISLKYLMGLAVAEVTSASGSFLTDFQGLHGNGRVDLRTALGGGGLSLDFGAAGQLSERFALTLGFQNIINNIQWKTEVRNYTYGVRVDSITVERLSETDADSLIDDYSEEATGTAFNSKLPKQILVGAAYTTRAFVYAFEYIQAFSNAPGVSTKPVLATGIEYRGIPFLPLRLGAALGGNQGALTSLGFGLNFWGFSLNFASQAYRGFLIPGTGRGIALAFDMKIGL